MYSLNAKMLFYTDKVPKFYMTLKASAYSPLQAAHDHED